MNIANQENDEVQAMRTFSTQKHVLKYLQDSGYKISRSHLSRHIRARRLRKKEGVFLQKAVDRYAELDLIEAGSGKGISGERMDSLQIRKLRAEIKLKEEQAKKARIEREAVEGKCMDRTEHELHMAMAASVLEAGLKYFYKIKADDIIALVGGDPARSGELVAFLRMNLDEQLTTFARPKEYEIEIGESG